MQITLEYTAQLKRASGTADEEIDVPEGTTLQELLRHAAERHGEELEALLLRDQDCHPSILIFVGNDQVHWETRRPLQDHDRVTLLSPISGG